SCPAGRLVSAAVSMASASPGVGYREDHECPGGRGEVNRAPDGRIHSEPGLERPRRACARQVTTGRDDPTFAQCTKKLGSVAARSASSLTLTSAPRYLPAESSPITPAAPLGVKE